MTTRRIISFVLATTLLLSLLVPADVAARTCGGTARVIAAVEATARKGHGCKTCTKAKAADVSGATIRSVKGHASYAQNAALQHMLCCFDGRSSHRPTIDVPTLTTADVSATIVTAAFVPALFSDAIGIAPPSGHPYKIDSSPPYLAAVHQHIYLHTSAFLI